MSTNSATNALPSTLNTRAATPRIRPRIAPKIVKLVSAVIILLPPPLMRNQTGKAHEGQSQYSCCDECDRRTGKSWRHIGQCNTFAHAGEQHQYQRETYRGTKATNQAYRKSTFFLHVEQREAEHSTVGGNQRQVNTQHLIQRRADFAYHHLGELNHSSNDQYVSCLLYTSPSPRDRTRSRMPSSA